MRYVSKALAAAAVFVCLLGSRTATAQYGVIYNFEPHNGGAVNPLGTLRADIKGNLFGDTDSGATFELTRLAGGGYTEKTPFTGPGGSEWIADAQGNYYAGLVCTSCTATAGQIIEASPTSSGGWTRKAIYTFGASSKDGVQPGGNLVFDVQGNLYGTTSAGGANGLGTVFELTPSASGKWTEKIVYSFGATSTDAINPTTGLTIDANGNLYGTTYVGGPLFYQSYFDDYVQGGTVFELTRQSNGTFKESIIYAFTPSTVGDFEYQSPSNGSNPGTSLVLDNMGNLYGTTTQGETTICCSGPGGFFTEGTVFELSPAASGQWTYRSLFLSCEVQSNGFQPDCFPQSALTLDPAGNLYDTTAGGGGSNLGVADGTGDFIFKITPQWQQVVLYNLPTVSTDSYPDGGIALYDGNLFGLTYNGGPDKYGTAYEIQGVTSATPVATKTTLVGSPSTNLVAGEPITLTATVTADPGVAIPTGTVTFADPAGHGVTQLLVAGKAVYTGVVPPVGTYSVLASYSGDPAFAQSKSRSSRNPSPRIEATDGLKGWQEKEQVPASKEREPAPSLFSECRSRMLAERA